MSKLMSTQERIDHLLHAIEELDQMIFCMERVLDPGSDAIEKLERSKIALEEEVEELYDSRRKIVEAKLKEAIDFAKVFGHTNAAEIIERTIDHVNKVW